MKKRARRNHTPAFKAKVALAGRKTIERLHSLLSSSTCIPDISYIPMARGFVYLTAVMDWFTRRILAWRLSNTMEASFCIYAVEEALQNTAAPQIFNTDQGSQFTSTEFTSVLINNVI